MALIPLLLIAFSAWLTGRVAQKAGYSAWWGLIQFVPLLGIVMTWVFAFIDWPALRRPGDGADIARLAGTGEGGENRE